MNTVGMVSRVVDMAGLLGVGPFVGPLDDDGARRTFNAAPNRLHEDRNRIGDGPDTIRAC
ncbi:MAG: hypothetical protein ABS81_13270 [Pseudonocardia sp. SCN 72-86]|nr:MAG: hypothetical protein ABS81_13270 [Pseudonocardia sp. SCN 72-86]